METINPDVKNLIMALVNDAMEKQDRYVTINFMPQGPFVSIYPFGGDDDDEAGSTEE